MSGRLPEKRSEIGVKRIGLIGGLSPESTAHYYEIICREYNRQFGRLNFPEMTIESLNLQSLVELFEINDWEGVARFLLQALADARRALSIACRRHRQGGCRRGGKESDELIICGDV
jgi:hypothetical protein